MAISFGTRVAEIERVMQRVGTVDGVAELQWVPSGKCECVSVFRHTNQRELDHAL